uniref:Uncharacterized protein n=1 Tax=Oncorhynchus kisutch TaxID=8019 RepID=A0A8C7NAJ9_ONCKI
KERICLCLVQGMDEESTKAAIEDTIVGIYIIKDHAASEEPEDTGIVLEGIKVFMELNGENFLTKLLHLKTGCFSELFCVFQTLLCFTLYVELVRLFTKTQNRMSKDGALVILLDIFYYVLSRSPSFSLLLMDKVPFHFVVPFSQ